MAEFSIPQVELNAVCRKYNLKELAIFGSALTNHFDENSDIDLLYTFQDNARYSLFDMVDIKKEVEKIFGRSVDLISRKAIENSRNIYRKSEILKNSKVIYAS